MLQNDIQDTTIIEDKADVAKFLGLDDDDVVENNSSQIQKSGSQLLTPLTDRDFSSIISPFDSVKDGFFVDLEPEMPQAGTRLPFKFVDYQINNNQPTQYGMKTSIRLSLNGYYGDEKFLEITETFYLTPGGQIHGRFKTFCQDLFSAFGLKSADLKDLVGREGTAIISYTTGSDGITRWPHLSQFKSLS